MLPTGIRDRRSLAGWLVVLVTATTAGCACTPKSESESQGTQVLPNRPNSQVTPWSDASANTDIGESDAGASSAGLARPAHYGKLLPNSPCWYGNYLGPGNCGYDVLPIDALDAAAREHDLAYDRCGVGGPKGAFLCLDVGKADWKLAKDALKAWPDVKFQGKMVSVATAITFGPLGLTKIAALGVVTAVHHVEDRIEGKPRVEPKGEATISDRELASPRRS